MRGIQHRYRRTLRFVPDVAVAFHHLLGHPAGERGDRGIGRLSLRHPTDEAVSQIMPAVTHLGCFAGVFPSLLPFTDRPGQFDTV